MILSRWKPDSTTGKEDRIGERRLGEDKVGLFTDSASQSLFKIVWTALAFITEQPSTIVVFVKNHLGQLWEALLEEIGREGKRNSLYTAL